MNPAEAAKPEPAPGADRYSADLIRDAIAERALKLALVQAAEMESGGYRSGDRPADLAAKRRAEALRRTFVRPQEDVLETSQAFIDYVENEASEHEATGRRLAEALRKDQAEADDYARTVYENLRRHYGADPAEAWGIAFGDDEGPEESDIGGALYMQANEEGVGVYDLLYDWNATEHEARLKGERFPRYDNDVSASAYYVAAEEYAAGRFNPEHV